MEGIIDGLLALSRASRAEMACETLDLTTLGELVTYELRHGKILREVECKVEPGQWLGRRAPDDDGVAGLFGNAWKFTGAPESDPLPLRSARRTHLVLRD